MLHAIRCLLPVARCMVAFGQTEAAKPGWPTSVWLGLLVHAAISHQTTPNEDGPQSHSIGDSAVRSEWTELVEHPQERTTVREYSLTQYFLS